VIDSCLFVLIIDQESEAQEAAATDDSQKQGKPGMTLRGEQVAFYMPSTFAHVWK
jgi:hypothetical protein